MGGLGSGRDKYATTPDVEKCRHLDVDRLKAFTEQPGLRRLVWWGDREDPAASLTVEAAGERDLDDETRAARLRLIYTLTDGHTAEDEDVEYAIPLEYTACNFGGYRPWFRCPGLVDGEHCNRRSRKLYFPLYAHEARYFLCRECYGLGYRSSRDSGNELERAEQRYRKAFAKADAESRRPHPNQTPYSPDRPTGMHHDTFEELLAEVCTAETEWNVRHIGRMRQILGRYSDTAFPEEFTFREESW